MTSWSNTRNRIENLFSTPGRVAGIVANTGLDLFTTLTNWGTRVNNIGNEGIQQARNIIQEAGQGNFGQKLVKIPRAAVLATGKVVETIVRAIAVPAVHVVRDAFDVVGNPITNMGTTITYMPSSKNPSDYTFEKLKYRPNAWAMNGGDFLKLMPWKSSKTTP
jgi:hypothetical protein